MAESFEKYLYQKHRAVHVRPLSELATDINLLDILIKTKNEGSHPVLYRAGSMLDLGISSDLGASSSEVIATQKRLSEGLQQFEKGQESTGADRGLFKWTWAEHDVYEHTFGAKSALTGSILAGVAEADLHLSDGNNLTCRVEKLQTACVSKPALVEIVTGKKPSWKPDISKPGLRWPDKPICSCLPFPLPFGQERGRKLWVIHQLLYASKVVVKSGDSSKNGGGVHVNLVPSAAPAATSSVGTVERSHENTNNMEITLGAGSKFPGKFMLGFRALCFQFSPEGNYVAPMEDDAGDVQPIHRGKGDNFYDDERAQLHDLYLQCPPENYDFEDEDEEEAGSWDVKLLPIHLHLGKDADIKGNMWCL